MYLLQPSTIVGSPPSQMVFGMALMGRSSAHGKRQIDKRIRQSQVLRQGFNITLWMWAIVSTSHPTMGSKNKNKISTQPKNHWHKSDLTCVMHTNALSQLILVTSATIGGGLYFSSQHTFFQAGIPFQHRERGILAYLGPFCLILTILSQIYSLFGVQA